MFVGVLGDAVGDRGWDVGMEGSRWHVLLRSLVVVKMGWDARCDGVSNRDD